MCIFVKIQAGANFLCIKATFFVIVREFWSFSQNTFCSSIDSISEQEYFLQTSDEIVLAEFKETISNFLYI